MKKVIVKQAHDDEVPVEILASSIRAIAAAVKKLRKGPLDEKALLLLIHQNTKAVGPKFNKHKPSITEIKAVLDSMESLAHQYLKS